MATAQEYDAALTLHTEAYRAYSLAAQAYRASKGVHNAEEAAFLTARAELQRVDAIVDAIEGAMFRASCDVLTARNGLDRRDTAPSRSSGHASEV